MRRSAPGSSTRPARSVRRTRTSGVAKHDLFAGDENPARGVSCLPRRRACRPRRRLRLRAAARGRNGRRAARCHDRADDHGRLWRTERARSWRPGRARPDGEGHDRRHRALSGKYRIAGGTARAHGLFARRQILAGPLHRRRSGRRIGAAAFAGERSRLLSFGAERRRQSELRFAGGRRASLCDDGGGTGQSRLQYQFRSRHRPQPQPAQLRDRAARPKFRRRSQQGCHARRRLHPRPSRGRHRSRGEALPRTRLEQRRQPRDARRHLRELAGDRDRALQGARRRTACSMP